MKTIQIDTMTCGRHFIPAIFNGDFSKLGDHEKFLLQRELRWYNMECEEGYPDFMSVEFECTSSERYVCPCDITGHMGDCVEVKVFVALDENYVKD